MNDNSKPEKKKKHETLNFEFKLFLDMPWKFEIIWTRILQDIGFQNENFSKTTYIYIYMYVCVCVCVIIINVIYIYIYCTSLSSV